MIATLRATRTGLAAILLSACSDQPAGPVPVASVEIAAPASAVGVGDTTQLSVLVRDASGNILSGRVVTWASEAPSIATVDSIGRVVALSSGAAAITAAAEGHVGRLALAVGPPGPLQWSPVAGPLRRDMLQAVSINGAMAVAVTQAGLALRSADGGATWDVLHPFTRPRESLEGVSGGGGYWLAVAVNGRIYRGFEDATIWHRMTSPTSRSLRDVAQGGTTAVAVGDEGTLVRSTDRGFTWTVVATGTTRHLSGVAAGAGTWVAVGAGGTILRSTDGGGSWSAAVSPTTDALHDVAVSGTTWVAVGDQGRILRSTDDGASWMPVTSAPAGGRLTGVSFAGSSGYAVGDQGRILRSANTGATWSHAVAPVASAPSLSDVSASGSTVVAVGHAGAMQRSSNGGATWSSVTPQVQSHLSDVAGSGSTYVAVGSDATILRSTDHGASWMSISGGGGAPDMGEVYDVAVSGSTWIIVGTHILRSTDGGATWSTVGSPFSGLRVSASGRTWVATGGNSFVRSTDDGLTWNRVATPYPQINSPALSGLGASGDTWVAVSHGAHYAPHIARSTNAGASWTETKSLPRVYLDGAVVAMDSTWIAVGRETLRSTDDGESWVAVNSGTQNILHGVTRFGSVWLAVGRGGTIVRSTDAGATWQFSTGGTEEDLTGVAATSERNAVAVGYRGVIVRGTRTR